MSRQATGRAWPAPAAGAALLLAGAAQVLPAGTWLPGPRRALFPALSGLGRADHVALTFDDGPDPRTTPRFLDALDGLAVRATFFVLGERLAHHWDLGREIVRRGHELAVHGWTHDRPWRPSPFRESGRLSLAAHLVAQAYGSAPLWYRPPFGILTGDRLAAARTAGLRPVLWSAWGRDWTSGATARSVLALLLRDLRGGGTVLLHDTDREGAPGCWQAALGALPGLVAACREAGLAVGPLGDHEVNGGHRRGAKLSGTGPSGPAGPRAR